MDSLNINDRPGHSQTIRLIHQWTPTLWTLRLQKPDGFTFEPGHYVRLGLGHTPDDIVWRAYSIVSAPQDPELEFLIGLIPDGDFCTRLAALDVGDSLLVDARAMGFFVASQLAPGENAWMLATGTGVGPYVSMLRDTRLLEAYQRLVVVHSVRYAAELAYRDEWQALARHHAGRLIYLPIVTRETTSALQGRIPRLLETGELERASGVELARENARVMVCGNPEFTTEMRALLNERGFIPCRRGMAGSMLFENYWQKPASGAPLSPAS